MPYRRLPKTDAARLKALKMLLENESVYAARNRFIDWSVINRARPAYDRLLTAAQQYRTSLTAQARQTGKIDRVQRNAVMYVSHFLQVLFMSVERGEIKKSALKLYGLSEHATSLPNLKTQEGLAEYGKRVIEGEKERIKQGGRPIYNPTIGMVSTHYDIFMETYKLQKSLQARTNKAVDTLHTLRPETDNIILDLWNQIEKHFEHEPPEVRFAECRKLGVIYYYRRNEEHLY